MKKILLSVLIVLLLLLVIFMAKDGIKIGDFQIMSVSQISDKNLLIDSKIEEANRLISVEYPKKNEELKNESQKMINAKELYLKETANSTEEEILKATMQETYELDFLFTRIGNHVKEEGVYAEMAVVTGDSNEVNDINFTVDGTYIGITNFIYAIENDTKLNYRIKNFKLLSKSGDTLRATFVVKNVRINQETLNRQSASTSYTNTENQTTNEQTTNNQATNNQTTSNQ